MATERRHWGSNKNIAIVFGVGAIRSGAVASAERVRPHHSTLMITAGLVKCQVLDDLHGMVALTCPGSRRLHNCLARRSFAKLRATTISCIDNHWWSCTRRSGRRAYTAAWLLGRLSPWLSSASRNRAAHLAQQRATGSDHGDTESARGCRNQEHIRGFTLFTGITNAPDPDPETNNSKHRDGAIGRPGSAGSLAVRQLCCARPLTTCC
jgi:hypothetical protein